MSFGMLSSTLVLRRHGQIAAPPVACDGPASEQADPQREDLLVFARGLGLLLEQCSPRGAERQFPASLQLHRELRPQLDRGITPLPCPHLLSDLCHEVAGHVAAPVLQAALRCLQRHAARRAAVSPQPA